MKGEEIMKLLTGRIKDCYAELSRCRSHPPARDKIIEGLRSRLDELILHYSSIKDISFCEACRELHVPYADVNVGVSE